MSKNKLTLTSVAQTRSDAAEAVSRANAHLEAFKARIQNDLDLAFNLVALITAIQKIVRDGDVSTQFLLPTQFADALLPAAQSYGFTFIEHDTRKDVVVVVKGQAE